MANFLFKRQNERSYNIYLSRQLLGTVNLVDGRWNGTINREGVREQVVGFSSSAAAFHALVMALKLTRLHKQGGELIAFSRQGGTAIEENVSRERALRDYVVAFNAHNEGGAQLRIVQRRR
jgi:hypothetical protein